MFYIEVTLLEDCALGKAGQKVMINTYYIVVITQKDQNTVLCLNYSDDKNFVEVLIKESYDKWHKYVRLNP